MIDLQNVILSGIVVGVVGLLLSLYWEVYGFSLIFITGLAFILYAHHATNHQRWYDR